MNLRMFSRRAAIIVVIVAFCGIGRAEVPLREYMGVEAVPAGSQVLAGATEAGLSSGLGAVFGNPAALGFACRPAVLLGYQVVLTAEERTRVVYDQFENSLGEAAFADNTAAHGVFGPVAGAIRFGPVGVGAGIGQVRDFVYSYVKEYRDDFYVKIGEDRIEQSGAIYAANVGAGLSLTRWGAFGARVGYQFGNRRLSIRRFLGRDTILQSESGSPIGINGGAGVAFRVTSDNSLTVGFDLDAGICYRHWLHSESSGVGVTTSRRFPSSGRLAISWQIPGTLPARTDAELRYAMWRLVDTTLGNVLVCRVGVEHLMLNFVRLRYGMDVEPLPFDPAVQVAQFGFGLGFDVGRLTIDAGLAFERGIIGAELFRVPLPESDVRCYQNRSVFAITLSREF